MTQLDSGPWLFEDWLGQQDAKTFYIRPKTTAQLRAYLATVNLRRLKIRGVGAGHSTSDVARPWRRRDDSRFAGVVVRTGELALDWPQLGSTWWKASAPSRLTRVEAGASIETLNKRFFDLGVAFPNLGSYDAQSIAGAIATGTHGSGMATGPLPDMVASIEMITVLDEGGAPVVRHVRLEPTDGPTDPDALKASRDAGVTDLQLIQEDDAFYSAVVGLGYFGIVTAVTLKLTSKFWLEESQQLMSWAELKPQLPTLAKGDYFDLVMSMRRSNVGPGGADYKLLATTRAKMPSLGWGNPRGDARRERLAGKNMSPSHLSRYLAGKASTHPRIGNREAVRTLESEVGRVNKSASHHIFRTSVGDLIQATSAEVAVPLDDAVTAIEAVQAHSEALWARGLVHTSPFGIRFGEASAHYLSMHYGRATCTIEAPMLIGTEAHSGELKGEPSEKVIAEVLGCFEAALRKAVPAARFHHGQRNHNGRAELEAYPKFAAWHAQYQRFNAFGVFDNEASARWKL